jgi:hypothetical protein
MNREISVNLLNKAVANELGAHDAGRRWEIRFLRAPQMAEVALPMRQLCPYRGRSTVTPTEFTPIFADAAIVQRMISSRARALLVSAFILVACGGSQKVPDAAAAPPASAATGAEPVAAAVDAPAKPAATEPDVDATGCKKNEDCSIFADCCSCKAVLASKPSLVPCDSVCGESKCEVKQITLANVSCDAGRCVIKKSK